MAYKTFANGFPLPASDLNNYLMNQSVIVFADSTARDAALPTPTEGMITYLEDTNLVEVYNGSAWTDINDNTAAIPKSTVTTAGDLIVADGASSVTRLGVGTDDQVLTLVSGAPAWADAGGGGGMELISTTTITGSGVTISAIPGTYKAILFRARNIITTTSSATLTIKPNSLSGYAYYVKSQFGWDGGSNTGFIQGALYGNVTQDIGSSYASDFTLVVDGYAGASQNKTFQYNGQSTFGGGAYNRAISGGGAFLLQPAYTSFSFISSSGTTTGTIELYGVN
jgi:hypothetical protein